MTVSMMGVVAHADGEYVKYNDVKEELGAIPKEALDLELKMAFCGKAFENEFWRMEKEGAEAAAAAFQELGIKLDMTVQAANGEADVQGQETLLKGFINEGYDGIMVAPISDSNLTSALEEGVEAGIPFIYVNDKDANVDLPIVGADHEDTAHLAAQWIADKIGMLRASIMLYVMVIVGCFLCTLAGNRNFVVAVMAVVLLSFGLAVVSVSISIYASKVASESDYSRTVTTFQFLNACGGLLFGRIPGMIADAQGTYVPAFSVMMALSVVGAVVMVIVYRRIRHEDHIYVRAHRAQPVNLAHVAK